MVNEIAVNPAVAVLKGMHVDEPKGQHRRGDHRIEPSCRAAVESGHAVDQRTQVLRPGAEVIGNRHARLPVVLADEAPVFPQSELHEAGIANDYCLQPQQLL